MPTSTSGRVERTATYYESTTNGLTWRKTNTTKWYFYKRYRSWPSTVRRKYPADEFLDGTARTTTSLLQNDTGYTYEETSYPRQKMENVSVLSNYRPSNVPTILLSISRERMYNSIRAQIRGDGVNLAMIMGEYRQTARLYRDLAEVVASRGHSLIRKHPRTGEYTGEMRRDDAARAYLAYTYGIEPLARDIAQAVRNLREALSAPLFVEGVVQRKVSKIVTGTIAPSNLMSASLKANYQAKRDLYYRTRWRAYLNKLSSGQDFLVKHGFANLPALAWNLLPFSFLADWWINIGQTLESLDNIALIERLIVLDSESDRLGIMIEPRAGKIQTTGMGFDYQRTDIRSVPKEITQISSFKYKQSSSARHCVTAVALMQSLRRKLPVHKYLLPLDPDGTD